MAVSVRIDINNRFMERLLRSPAGPIARNMVTRGNKVKRAAQRRINSRTGELARSIDTQIVIVRGVAGVQVGSSLFYARFVHDGTGIYGRGTPIRPTNGKALSFTAGGRSVVVASSKGQRGTHFFTEALSAAG